ncbi:ABC transporter permease [Rhodococcus sp. NPDC060176]|uniref:ABC transporter permease n=1 Tax=Rhodococcus sp. NPDC060176 TaxID=3347062 RepID=UPI0036547EC5
MTTANVKVPAHRNPAAGAAPTSAPGPKTGLMDDPRHRAMVVRITRVAFVLLVLVAWQLASGWLVDDFLISNPIAVAQRLANSITDSTMHENIITTGTELIYGWTIGATAGALIGWFIGSVKFFGEVLEPIIIAVNGIPKVVLAPLFLLWFGLGIGSKVAIAAMIVFFLVFNNVYQGMRNVPQPLVDVAKVMGASRLYIVRRVVLPSVSVPLFAALRIGVSMAMIGVIAGEFVSADKGLGYYAMASTQKFDSAGLFAAIVIIVAMVVALSSIVGIFQRRALAWQQN